MVRIINVADLVNPEDLNGLTYRETNNKLTHKYPLDTLVEVKYDRWFDGACMKVHARLWVVQHTRDCDGTPLYSLSNKSVKAVSKSLEYYKYNHDNSMTLEEMFKRRIFIDVYEHGFSENSLTPVEITDKLLKGYDALEW